MSHPGGQQSQQGVPQGYPQQSSPQQPGSPQGFPQQGQPQRPAYQAGSPQGFAQPGHPQPGSPRGFARPGRPGHPAQPGEPQWGAPAQQYSQQQGFPPQQRPAAGPLTLAGWAAAPAILGVVLELVALFALPWITFTNGSQSVTMSFLDLFKRVSEVGADGFAAAYVHFLAFIITAATAVSVLPWTLGGLRAKRSAFLLSGIRSRDLTRANFWWYRAVFGGRATVMLVLHLAGIATMYWGSFSQLGIGPILLVAGAVLVVAGAAVGPRRGPAMP
ncbi:hypothetical protein [Amycolatopsis sp. FDAARGOS 1241]|uniref:hypothetical protein n=1 Tax=Amycolatopsis sp. FDAARGOS 1241 TaxID=2778070 RepID=UPI001950DE8E|nr:hypothetical protein [Amycolatopsis sp. FDAARGOS 1241]QRP44796.1 hypothetical protein I6J71_37100 [Amycolatopsis sp. FDAARGOS 1241]